MKKAATIMVQGTASSVGKSVLVTALCRIFRQDGYRVAPFKSQNMALNSAVTVDGGEIGRAQAQQAAAAGVDATVDMNPILMKPEADSRSQIVVLGRPWQTLQARDYQQRKEQLLGVVQESLERLRATYDIVAIEGAGSPAEINLRAHEIVNMRIAHLAGAPVILAGDIDRGGVFASLVGTMELLEPADRERVLGFVINKFRGDVSLLKPGLDFLEQRCGKPVLGVIPYLRDLGLAEEDSVALDSPARAAAEGRVEIAVIRLPHIANYDDFDPLAAGANVRFVSAPTELGSPDLIVIPGTKSTVADLAWLRSTGLAGRITRAAEAGLPVLGICGGYQMLGKTILDPDLVEASDVETSGLGMLDITTTFEAPKQTVRVRGTAGPGFLGAAASGTSFAGYEIHHGVTALGGEQPWLSIAERQGSAVDTQDGAVSRDGLVAGCYIHGLFDDDSFRAALLGDLAARSGKAFESIAFERESTFDRLAAHVRAHLDLDAIYAAMGLQKSIR